MLNRCIYCPVYHPHTLPTNQQEATEFSSFSKHQSTSPFRQASQFCFRLRFRPSSTATILVGKRLTLPPNILVLPSISIRIIISIPIFHKSRIHIRISIWLSISIPFLWMLVMLHELFVFESILVFKIDNLIIYVIEGVIT